MEGHPQECHIMEALKFLVVVMIVGDLLLVAKEVSGRSEVKQVHAEHLIVL
jgi:hypothetical protein